MQLLLFYSRAALRLHEANLEGKDIYHVVSRSSFCRRMCYSRMCSHTYSTAVQNCSSQNSSTSYMMIVRASVAVVGMS